MRPQPWSFLLQITDLSLDEFSLRIFARDDVREVIGDIVGAYVAAMFAPIMVAAALFETARPLTVRSFALVVCSFGFVDATSDYFG